MHGDRMQGGSGSMKTFVVAFLPGVLLIPCVQEPVLAHKPYSQSKTCDKTEYVEAYHPGTREKPGYVSGREEKVAQPCSKNLHFHGQTSHRHRKGDLVHDHHAHSTPISGARPVAGRPVPQDNNSCLEGTLAGGVLGGALGGILSKKDNWIWTIPAGAVGGALVGCQVDGG